jgi:hypothetical protein
VFKVVKMVFSPCKNRKNFDTRQENAKKNDLRASHARKYNKEKIFRFFSPMPRQNSQKIQQHLTCSEICEF